MYLHFFHERGTDVPTQSPTVLGMIGQGRMGLPMTELLRSAGHPVVAYDLNPAFSDVDDLASLAQRLGAPGTRKVWTMLAESITGETITTLSTLLSSGDIVINGANDYPRNDIKYAEILARFGISYLDVGVSGGVLGGREGPDSGYALSVGGSIDVVSQLMPIFESLKPAGPFGFSHAGTRIGDGHAAKLVHNLIEYALMAALGEGYTMLKALGLDIQAVLNGWRNGTIIQSRLLDLLSEGLDAGSGSLARFSPHVPNGGSGREAMMLALQNQVPMPVCAAALQSRFVSCDERFDAQRAQNELRWFFGEHRDALA